MSVEMYSPSKIIRAPALSGSPTHRHGVEDPVGGRFDFIHSFHRGWRAQSRHERTGVAEM